MFLANFPDQHLGRLVALDFCLALLLVPIGSPRLSFSLVRNNLNNIVSLWTGENEPDVLSLQYKLILITHVRRDVDVINVCGEEYITQRRGTICRNLLLFRLKVKDVDERPT
jgi:hypothetical protein